jgi:hypothetical protein
MNDNFFVTIQCKPLIKKIVAILECAINVNIIDLTKKKVCKTARQLNHLFGPRLLPERS